MSEKPEKLRIKLAVMPADYDNYLGQSLEPKPFSLEEYKTILEAQTRFAAVKMADDLMKPNYMADMLYYGYEPPTRWQRFKYRLQDIKQRAKDIWTIVSGGDVHSDCGY